MTNSQDDAVTRVVLGAHDTMLYEEDFLVLPSSGMGPVFLEGILLDILPGGNIISLALQQDLEKRLTSVSFAFELSKDILADSDNAPSALGSSLYERCKHALKELKVVEYNWSQTRNICYSAPGTTVCVNLYSLNNTERVSEEDSKLPQADTTYLPHIRLNGRWDELVFEYNYKRELIWTMTNILRSAQTASDVSEDADMRPIIMLHGPPGTGKTSLCEGLAQKISIRLSHTYKSTRLVQIKSSTLLSKYFSESAKVIEEVFAKLAQMCRDKPSEFLCVLVDEVEGLAMSRETSTRQGECHDSLRACNALLTGLDGARGYRNIIFLCTTNMIGLIEPAFLDRCGLVLAINHPSPASQYTILRGKIQKLIGRGRLSSDQDIPYYDEALVDARIDSNRPGSKLLHIIDLIRLNNVPSSFSRAVSGRSLAQLPGQAMLRYMRTDKCDLDMLLHFMEQSLSVDRNQGTVVKQDENETRTSPQCRISSLERKRKIHLIIEEPDEEDFEACKQFFGAIKIKREFSRSHEVE